MENPDFMANSSCVRFALTRFNKRWSPNVLGLTGVSFRALNLSFGMTENDLLCPLCNTHQLIQPPLRHSFAKKDLMNHDRPRQPGNRAAEGI
jgi:hypothetical protein